MLVTNDCISVKHINCCHKVLSHLRPRFGKPLLWRAELRVPRKQQSLVIRANDRGAPTQRDVEMEISLDKQFIFCFDVFKIGPNNRKFGFYILASRYEQSLIILGFRNGSVNFKW